MAELPPLVELTPLRRHLILRRSPRLGQITSPVGEQVHPKIVSLRNWLAREIDALRGTLMEHPHERAVSTSLKRRPSDGIARSTLSPVQPRTAAAPAGERLTQRAAGGSSLAP